MSGFFRQNRPSILRQNSPAATIKDFLEAVQSGKKPLVDATEGRRTVELFTAIYRSTKDNAIIKFPLK